MPSLIVAAVLAGGATGLAFAPTRWLALVVLGPAVGLWAAATSGTPRRGAVCGLAYGVGFAFPALRWMLELDPVAGVVLPIVQGLFWMIIGAVSATTARLRAGWWVAATAATWLLVEALRARFPLTGFEWGQLSMAGADLPVRPAVAVVGALGLTGLLVAVAAGLAAIATHRRRRRAMPLVVAALLLGLAVGAGGHAWTAPDGELKVAIVQVDDPCPGAFAADCPGYIDQVVRAYVEGTGRLAATPDLVVWGEDALPGAATREAAGAELLLRSGGLPAPVLAGVGTPTTPGRFVRWAALFDRDGTALDGYAKRMPVPFGEYVPLRSLLGGVSDVGRLVPSDLEAGDDASPVVLRTATTTASLGTVVSWEVSFARAVRAVASDANGLATLTTVASYGTSAASDQLLDAARLRAAEHQKPMIVAATTGRSALISLTGQVTAAAGLFRADQLEGAVQLRAGRTPYARTGDLPAVGVAIVVLLGVMLAARRAEGGAGRGSVTRAAVDEGRAEDPVAR